MHGGTHTEIDLCPPLLEVIVQFTGTLLVFCKISLENLRKELEKGEGKV